MKLEVGKSMGDRELPDYTPKTENVMLDEDRSIRYSYGQQYPSTFKLPDGRTAVDAWRGVDGKVWVKAWLREDHPNLDLLPTDAPRAVKSLYTADVQAKILRYQGEVFGHPVWIALKAWEKYERAE